MPIPLGQRKNLKSVTLHLCYPWINAYFVPFQGTSYRVPCRRNTVCVHLSFYGSKRHKDQSFVKIAHTVSNHFIPVYRRILYERWQITKPWSRAESRLNFQLIAHHAVDKVGSFRSFKPSKFNTTRASPRS